MGRSDRRRRHADRRHRALDRRWRRGRPLDPATLDQIGADEEGQYYPLGIITAAPGLWLDDGNILISDEQLGRTEVPWLWGPLATDGTSVWVLDDTAGIAQLRAG